MVSQPFDNYMDLVEAASRYPALKKEWVEFLGEKPDPVTDRVETASVGGPHV